MSLAFANLDSSGIKTKLNIDNNYVMVRYYKKIEGDIT